MPVSPSMAEVSAWLRHAAGASRDPADLLTGLAECLVRTGLKLEAMTLEIATLHPLMAGSVLVWHRDRPATLETPRFHHVFGTDASAPIEPPTPEAETRGAADALPLVVTLSDGSCHRLTAVPAGQGGFTEAEAGLLREVARSLAAPLDILLQKQITRTLMTTYLGARTAERVLSGAIQRGASDSVNAVLWYSDLRDFTAWSERLPGDAVVALLNSHFERLAAPIKAFGGEVLKFMGDGLLAIFPIDEAGSTARACGQAIKAARSARAGMASLNSERRGRGASPLAFGVALHVGEVMYGNIGAPDRLDFTVIGPTVNLASRLEALCKPLNRPVLISAAFENACAETLVSLGRHHLPDAAGPIEVFTLNECQSPARPSEGR